jgi:hypothetical protein
MIIYDSIEVLSQFWIQSLIIAGDSLVQRKWWNYFTMVKNFVRETTFILLHQHICECNFETMEHWTKQNENNEGEHDFKHD